MIILIACVDVKTNGIGYRGMPLYQIPKDIRRFEELTTGHTVVMGRKTYESFGKPLPNRHNIVITRSLAQINGCRVYNSIDPVLCHHTYDDVYIVGGRAIYEAFLPYTHRIELTIVGCIPPRRADTFFPELGDEWEKPQPDF